MTAPNDTTPPSADELEFWRNCAARGSLLLPDETNRLLDYVEKLTREKDDAVSAARENFERALRYSAKTDAVIGDLQKELDQTQGDLNVLRFQHAAAIQSLRDAEAKCHRYESALGRVAEDDDPEDGCSHALEAKTALNDAPTKEEP